LANGRFISNFNQNMKKQSRDSKHAI